MANPQLWAERIVALAHAMISRNGRGGDDIEEAIEMLRGTFAAYDDDRQRSKPFLALGRAFARRERGESSRNLFLALHYFGRTLQGLAKAGEPKRIETIQEIVDELSPFTIANDSVAKEFCIECLRSVPGMFVEGAKLWEIILLLRALRRLAFRNWEAAEEHLLLVLNYATVHHSAALATSCLAELASIYSHRTDGDPIENAEAAADYAKRALVNLSADEDPLRWIDLQRILIDSEIQRVPIGVSMGIEPALAQLTQIQGILPRLKSVDAAHGNTLAFSLYRKLSARGHDFSEEAFRRCEAALAAVDHSSEPLMWATAHANLGASLLERTHGDPRANLNSAAEAIKRSLSVFTRRDFHFDWALAHHNLGRIAFRREELGEQGEAEGLEYFEKALSVFSAADYPRQHVHLQTDLAQQHRKKKRWEAAEVAYCAAIDVRNEVEGSVYSREGLELQSADRADLHAEAAWVLLHQGKVGQASRILEDGRARILSTVLKTRNPEDDPHVDPELARAVARARQKFVEADRWHNSFKRSTADRDESLRELKSAHEHLRDLLSELQKSHPDVLKPIEVNLIDAAPKGGAIVQLASTDEGSFAIIHMRGGDQGNLRDVLWLERFTTGDIAGLLHGDENSDGWLRIQRGVSDENDLSMRLATMAICSRLWDRLISPVVNHLKAIGLSSDAQVILLIGGNLSTLPLHAAHRLVGEKYRTFLDEFVITYAPSASALLAARKRQLRVSGPRDMLVVYDPTADDIAFAEVEADLVSTIGESAGVRSERFGASSSVADLLNRLPNSSHIHFACHGYYDWADPRDSALQIGPGDQVTIRQILSGEELTARIVVLSACETGLSDVVRAPDEFVGFRTAFLQAGACCVIGTLWRVPDDATMLLIVRFYREMFESGRSTAEALRNAQLWLRDADAAELSKCVRRIRLRDSTDHNCASNLENLDADLQTWQTWQPDAHPFENPYFWAAFALSGINVRMTSEALAI
jgi:CHAT domain-containing protein